MLTGVLRDKDYKFISKKLSEIAERAFTMTPDNKRALSAEEYAKTLSDEGVLASPCPDIKSAFETARAAAKKDEKPLVCLGSLYTYCDIIKYL